MLNEEWERYAQETGAYKDGNLSKAGIYMKLGFFAAANVIVQSMINGNFSQIDCIADIIEHSNSIKDELDEYRKRIEAIQEKAKEEPQGRDGQLWHTVSPSSWLAESYSQGTRKSSGDEQGKRDSDREQSPQEDA